MWDVRAIEERVRMLVSASMLDLDVVDDDDDDDDAAVLHNSLMMSSTSSAGSVALGITWVVGRSRSRSRAGRGGGMSFKSMPAMGVGE